MVKEAADRFRDVENMVAVGYVGVAAEDAAALRQKLREDNVDLRVVRNRVSRLAFAEIGREEFGRLLEGETAVISADDPVRASKAAVEFVRERKLELRGGWAQGRELSPEEVRRLATIPSREVLLARVAGLAAAPLRALVGMIQAPHASLARAIRAWNEDRVEDKVEGA
jgi:large subunit ribosomal protein L10